MKDLAFSISLHLLSSPRLFFLELQMPLKDSGVHAPVWQASPAASSTVGQPLNLVLRCGIALPAAVHRVWPGLSKLTTSRCQQRGRRGSVFSQAARSHRLVPDGVWFDDLFCGGSWWHLLMPIMWCKIHCEYKLQTGRKSPLWSCGGVSISHFTRCVSTQSANTAMNPAIQIQVTLVLL